MIIRIHTRSLEFAFYKNNEESDIFSNYFKYIGLQ